MPAHLPIDRNLTAAQPEQRQTPHHPHQHVSDMCAQSGRSRLATGAPPSVTS